MSFWNYYNMTGGDRLDYKESDRRCVLINNTCWQLLGDDHAIMTHGALPLLIYQTNNQQEPFEPLERIQLNLLSHCIRGLIDVLKILHL